MSRSTRSFFLPLLSVLLVLALWFPPSARGADPLSVSLFGPETFNYTTSTITRTFTCPATQGTFNLHVVNGDGAGKAPCPPPSSR